MKTSFFGKNVQNFSEGYKYYKNEEFFFKMIQFAKLKKKIIRKKTHLILLQRI